MSVLKSYLEKKRKVVGKGHEEEEKRREGKDTADQQSSRGS
jgi:hypothetical protein